MNNVLSAVTMVAAAAVLTQWVIKPYRCNLAKKEATATVILIDRLGTQDIRVAQFAHSNIELLRRRCDDCCAGDVARAMDLAASYRFLGRNREAAAIYQSALQYDRRAELYFNLGQTQADAGLTREGVQNLITACIYNPLYLDEIAEYHPEVRRAVDAYQSQLLQAAKHRP